VTLRQAAGGSPSHFPLYLRTLLGQVVGITVMLTSLGVLFALVVVARLKVVKLDSVASQEIGGVSYALPAEVSSRLAMAFGSQSAPLFPAAASSLKQEPSIYA